MSHEMRTPLNGIIGMLHLLKVDTLSSSQQEHLEIAEHSTNHLLGLINMILDHSKLEVGKLQLEHIPIDLDNDLTNLIKIFQYQAKEKNLKLHFIQEYDKTFLVKGDSLRIQQILINLLNNAIKFTNKGFVSLKISDINNTSTHQHVKFEVIDTGIGISSEDHYRLFDSFEQGDISTTRNYGGTGLGLTISNRLINLMGGSLHIDSTIGIGSRFAFEICFEKCTELNIKPSKVLFNINTENENIPRHVLIAEDNIINQKVLTKLLDRCNITYDIANNGKEAVSYYKENIYDLILMDLNMPIMDGIEASLHIKKSIRYLTYNTPIIAVTASAFDEDRERVLQNGLDDFLPKPLDFNLLKNTIKKYSPISLQSTVAI